VAALDRAGDLEAVLELEARVALDRLIVFAACAAVCGVALVCADHVAT
jgi:hypothetical protein